MLNTTLKNLLSKNTISITTHKYKFKNINLLRILFTMYSLSNLSQKISEVVRLAVSRQWVITTPCNACNKKMREMMTHWLSVQSYKWLNKRNVNIRIENQFFQKIGYYSSI